MFGKEVEKDQKGRNGPKNQYAGGGGGNASGSGGPAGGAKDTPGSKKRKRVFEDELAQKLLELDEMNRPKLKVALLSGPPGLGINMKKFEKLK